MKIATFNINDIRKRLPNLLAWLEEARPDVACLQETKVADEAFPADAITGAGYRAVWCGGRTWNGVAILAREADPILTQTTLPGDPSDAQPRYIEAAVNGVLIACLYAPNGNPQPGPKLDYKLAWLKRLREHARTLLDAGSPVVLAGDYNVVPTDADIYATRSWAKDALLHPKARAEFSGMLAEGWTDALRMLHPDDAPYTFWSYFRNRWPRDAGLRIDHLLLNDDARRSLEAAGVDKSVRGREGASDHAPVWIELQVRTTRGRRATPARNKRPLGSRESDRGAEDRYRRRPVKDSTQVGSI